MKSKIGSLRFLLAVLGGGLLGSTPAVAQDIVFSGGVGDLTFFYDSVNDTFDAVFRTKGNTVASGLTTPYGTPPMGVGGSADDYRFDSLTVAVSAAPGVSVNGRNYLVTPAAGTTYNVESQPDLGFRTRLREGDPAVNQFADFRVTLNLSESTFPAGADFILFRPGDPLLSEPANVILYETVANELLNDWSAWGHTHWHWGFSQVGDYTLAFDVQGLGGLHGPSSTGQVAVNFSVIPEPRLSALVFALIALVVFSLRKRKVA